MTSFRPYLYLVTLGIGFSAGILGRTTYSVPNNGGQEGAPGHTQQATTDAALLGICTEQKNKVHWATPST